ncbi:hypothetical protein RQC66_44455, partial [Streptomyces justiciae]|nr:hypothetical protein [Streptomyces justiciae]
MTGKRVSWTTSARTVMIRALPGSVSQGDQVVVRSDLFDEAHNKVGETHGTCTTTRGDADESEQCLVTYILPGGQLTTQGVYFNYIDQ